MFRLKKSGSLYALDTSLQYGIRALEPPEVGMTFYGRNFGDKV